MPPVSTDDGNGDGDGDALVDSFEVSLAGTSEGGLALRSVGTSRSIAVVADALLKVAERQLRPGDRVRSLVLRENAGPVSLPILFSGYFFPHVIVFSTSLHLI